MIASCVRVINAECRMPTKNAASAAVTKTLFEPANMMAKYRPRHGGFHCGTDQSPVDLLLHWISQ
jgi:hypothetical protein